MESVVNFRLAPALTDALTAPSGLHRDGHDVIASRNAFARLSFEEQTAIDGVSGEALARFAGTAWNRAGISACTTLEAAGYSFTPASPTTATPP